jgi:hypothetical protein
VLAVSLLMATAAVGLLACFMVRLFITLDAPGPKRWLLDGIVTGLAMLITAVWIVEHQVDLFAALGTGGMTGAIGGHHQLPRAAQVRVRSARLMPHCPGSPQCRLRSPRLCGISTRSTE